MKNKEHWHVTPTQDGMRLDHFLVEQLSEVSRSKLSQWIKKGLVQCNTQTVKPGHMIRMGDEISVEKPSEPASDAPPTPEPIPLDILYEDEYLMAINKPPGMVVHPAPGHSQGTLVNALLHHHQPFQAFPDPTRPGIVHRLDKDTSGVIVVAKQTDALIQLQDQFKQRHIKKTYLALVQGIPEPRRGTIKTQIGRSGSDRKKMSTTPPSGGREALSHYHVETQYPNHALLRVHIETGRTHQIRVHLQYIGHPICGDAVYGRPSKDQLPVPAQRQLLHAHALELKHPISKKTLQFEAPLAVDFQKILEAL